MYSRELTFDIILFPHLLNLHRSVASFSFSLAILPSHVSLQQRHIQPEQSQGEREGKLRKAAVDWTRSLREGESGSRARRRQPSGVCVAAEGCQVSHYILCIHFKRMNGILNIDLDVGEIV